MEEQQKGNEAQRADERQEQEQEKPRGEQEQRPKDLDPKDQAKDVKGGAMRYSDGRLKVRIGTL